MSGMMYLFIDWGLSIYFGPLLFDDVRHIPHIASLLLQQLFHLALQDIARRQRMAILTVTAIRAFPKP
jgi:hypothetical protein